MLQSHDHTDAVLPAGVNLLDEVRLGMARSLRSTAAFEG